MYIGFYLQLQSAVSFPTLVQVMSQAGPVVVTGAEVVVVAVVGSEVHQPSWEYRVVKVQVQYE